MSPKYTPDNIFLFSAILLGDSFAEKNNKRASHLPRKKMKYHLTYANFGRFTWPGVQAGQYQRCFSSSSCWLGGRQRGVCTKNAIHGFEQSGNDVLRLKKTLYMWITAASTDPCGSNQPELNPCLFVCEHVIAVYFVDGILFWLKDTEKHKHIHELAMQLRAEWVALESGAGGRRCYMFCCSVIGKEWRNRTARDESD